MKSAGQLWLVFFRQHSVVWGLVKMLGFDEKVAMPSSTLSYRQYVRRSLADLSARNPRYSLRAFAKKVGMSPSHLSRVVNGEAALSLPMAYKIAAKLDWTPRQTREFIDLVIFESADETTQTRILAKQKVAKPNALRRTLTLELFTILSDWYHLPIFELIKAQPDHSDAPTLSKRLGVSLAETKAALDRLENAGFISRGGGGRYEARDLKGLHTSDDVAHDAIQKHHRQMSMRAVEALSLPVHEREFQSLQLAFAKKDLTKAQKRIRQFLKDFEQEFMSPGATDIYQMNLQYFPLTRPVKRSET